jgi:molecular chaperone Hsp33
MSHKDTLQRFLFDEAPVKGMLVRLDSAWQQVLSHRSYPAPVAALLGEMMAASVLLSANLKFDGTLIMQLHGHGALKLAVVEANSDRTVRATARFNGDVAEEATLTEMLGDGGRFVITLEPKGEGEPWQGIVELAGNNLAEILMHYMSRSEQLDSMIKLETSGETAAGLLLQKLPDGHGEDDGWPRVVALADTLQREELLELPAEAILHRLYHEEQVRVFEPEAVAFACTCSRERVGGMLKMLGGEEIGEILIEQGSVEINCDFCHQRYVFDEEDVNELFDYNVVDAVREARH